MSSCLLLPLALIAGSFGASAATNPTSAVKAEGIGFDELGAGENATVIQEIETNTALSSDDPARNINLSVAYALQDLLVEARAHFEAALDSPGRAELETATGDWVDSRQLAREGLRKLAPGEFRSGTLAALR